VTLVPLLVIVTAAAGMTADVWSRTVPLTLAVLACGHAGAAVSNAVKTQNDTFRIVADASISYPS
jgi:hypothetical protein